MRNFWQVYIVSLKRKQMRLHITTVIRASVVWVEEVDRGGLTKITEEAHQFLQH